MTAPALTAAHDRLRALEGQTADLEAQVSSEAQLLERAQREARDGRGTLRQVVSAQGQADAARGVLAMHMAEVQQQRALVDDLETAQQVAQLVAQGQTAREEVHRLREEAAQLVGEAETALREAMTRFHALQAAHRTAQERLWENARQHAAHALGLTFTEVWDAVRWDNRGVQLTGPAGPERKQAVREALSTYGAQVGSSEGEIIAAANRAAPDLSPGRLGALMPTR